MEIISQVLAILVIG